MAIFLAWWGAFRRVSGTIQGLRHPGGLDAPRGSRVVDRLAGDEPPDEAALGSKAVAGRKRLHALACGKGMENCSRD